MRVLVDGDILVFRACFAAERTEYWVEYFNKDVDEDVAVWADGAAGAKALVANLEGRGVSSTVNKRTNLEPFSHAVKNLEGILSAIRIGTGSDDLHIALSGRTNFRDTVATIKPYKGNRDTARRPTYEHEMKQHIKDTYPTLLVEGQEADDTMGIAQYEMISEPGNEFSSVIATADKDLLMIPGLAFNFLKPELGARYVSNEEALDNFFCQWVSGDATDNIPGVPKYGPKKAKAALDEAGASVDRRIDVVRKLYDTHYEDGEAAMIENGRLLWIRRRPNEMFDLDVLKRYSISPDR